jgi:formylglycine-generating enzyme required for sulfatase activity
VQDRFANGDTPAAIADVLRASGWQEGHIALLLVSMSGVAAAEEAAAHGEEAMPETRYTNPKDGYRMALVPAGRAIFGSDARAFGNAQPQFELEMDGYHLGLFCVTNHQYAAFLNAVRPAGSDLQRWLLLNPNCHVVAHGSEYTVDDEERYGDHPVVQVSFYGAEAYCEWAGLRLPTELEWEKGARGWEGQLYPWGNKFEWTKCRNATNRGSEGTCPVWEYPEGVSPYGMYNMTGNVKQWMADWYEAGAYRRYAAGDLSPSKGDCRALRGGSYLSDSPGYFLAPCRLSRMLSSDRQPFVGFRCARGI